MICTVVKEKTLPQTLSLIKKALFAEIRLDLSSYTKDETAVIFSSHPRLIATYRSSDSVSDETRTAALLHAVKHGAWAVDLDLSDSFFLKEKIKRELSLGSGQLMLSYHNYETTPSSACLEEIITRCSAEGATLIKIVTTAHSREEVLRILSLYRFSLIPPARLITFAMGAPGRISRLAAPFLGAPFTYAAADPSCKTAPGQLTYDELKQIYSILLPRFSEKEADNI